jgi:dipeptidyl aminopeptidase/acylaminoacyl peptidase
MRSPSFVLVVLLLLVGCSPRLAQFPPLVPRALLFGNPLRTNSQISPDGTRLAYLAPDANNVLQIWARTLGGSDDRQLTAERTRPILHYTWAYDGEHLLFAQDTNGDENWHIHTVNIHSRTVRDLTPYKGVRAVLVAIDPGHPWELLIAMNLRNRRLHDVYRLNIKTGETLMVNRNGGRQLAWVADSQMRVRIATTLAGTIVRDTPRQPWRTLRPWQTGEPGRFIGFSLDEKTFYMCGSPDGDVGALLAVDVASGEQKIIAQDPKYDVEDVFVDPISREVQAVAFFKDKLEWQVIDQSVAEDFAALKKVREGQFSVIHPPYESPILFSKSLGRTDLQNKMWIVSYESDEGSIYYYAYDRESKTSRLLFNERPVLETPKLANTQPISYESRDGLTIHGYLTLPLGVPPKNLPVVLLVHGGPWSRDRWGYYDTVQWLANRGYVVLQVNYRGSTGYGRKFVVASYKEWGGKMHADLVDGVNWLIGEGIADSKKVAIMGSSYGGYATLVGLTFTPDLFVAGVSRVGISNLISEMKSWPPYWMPLRAMFALRVGDPAKEEDLLKARSPLFFVDRIKAPLLIAHSANDVRVVVQESEQIVEAMRKTNKPVEYLVYGDEGHSLKRPANKFHFYAKTEEFLARHLGGRFEPEENLTGHSAAVK